MRPETRPVRCSLQIIPEPFGRHPDPCLPGVSAGWWPKGFLFPNTMPVIRPDRPAITQSRLKELLHYDPETGVFTRRVSRSGGGLAGSVAGTVGRDGYSRIQYAGRQYLAHRLAFLYMTGEFPAESVDHINRDRSDNRWGNLRPASTVENLRNKSPYSNNSSGFRGVSLDKRLKKWKSYGAANGKLVYLGMFLTAEEAAATSRAWRDEHYGEFSAEAGQPFPSPVVS